jgi:glycine/serine hydroxymethyltransferase
MQQIAQFIAQVINNIGKEEVCTRVRTQTKELCSKFLMYEELL